MDDEERIKCVMLSRDQNAPKMPDDELLLSEIAVYSGGKDQKGRPIIAFPSRHQVKLGTDVKPTGLDHILRYYADLTSSRDKAHGLAFVTDLRFSTLEFISLLKSSINSLQAEMQGFGSKCILYAIEPQDKKILKDVMTVMALRVSKKKKNKTLASPIFQTVLVAEEAELHNYIDQSQLLTDMGGYLQYSHQAWVRFMKAVEPFFASFHECSFKYPSALESISRLTDLRLGHTQGELEQQLIDVNQSYEETLSESTIPSTLAKGSELLHKLKHSEEDTTFSEVAQKAVFQDTYSHARDCQANLKDMRSHIEGVFRNAESQITQAISALEYSAQLTQLIKWFTKDSKRLLRSREVGETSSRAEALKNHFETAELPLAEEKIANAEQLVERIQAMVVTAPQEEALSVKTQARRLIKILKEFRKRLDEKEDFYLAVSDYYVIFDEIDRWCDKVLKFLPPNIDKIHEFLSSNHLSRRAAILVEWRESLRRFQRRRPPPDDDDIINLEHAVKVIGDEVIKRRSLELTDRFDVLMSVLSAKRPALHTEVQQAMRWRYELLESGNPDSDRLSHSSSYMENRSAASGHEDQPEAGVDPLTQRLQNPKMTFDPSHRGGGDGVLVSDRDELDGGMDSGGSMHRSRDEDRASLSAHSQHSQAHSQQSQHSQASSVGRISSKDYYSGNIPPPVEQSRHEQYIPAAGDQRTSTPRKKRSQTPTEQYHQSQPAFANGHHQPQPTDGHYYSQPALLRQSYMLSASQPHLPTNADYFPHAGYVDPRYSPYIITNEYLHAGNNHPDSRHHQSLNRNRNNSAVSYIPMLSDIEGGNSSGADVLGHGDSSHHIANGGGHYFYSTAGNPQTVVRRGEGPINMQNVSGQHNLANNRDGSYLTTQQNGGYNMSPGQVPEPRRMNGGASFQTSTPVRGGQAPFIRQHEYIEGSIPFSQFTAGAANLPSNAHPAQISPGQRPSYDDIVTGIQRMQANGAPTHQPQNVTKSTPDLRGLSVSDMNFDLDPEVVASELDSDEQVEYYRRVCGFLKSLPTKKRKPRRLRTRQAKAKEPVQHDQIEGDRQLDKASEYSRSTGSLFDNSVNEDISFGSGQNHMEGSLHRPGDVAATNVSDLSGTTYQRPLVNNQSGPTHLSHDPDRQTLTRDPSWADQSQSPPQSHQHSGQSAGRGDRQGYEVGRQLVDRPPTGMGGNHSPIRRRNLIPDGTPPIAPLTDSLRRFLEDTEQHDGGRSPSPAKAWGDDMGDDGGLMDEDLRRYEELLSQREEDLENLKIPGEDDTDIEDEDLLEHEAFLTQLASVETDQGRRQWDSERLAAESSAQIGQADRLLQKLQEEGDGSPRKDGRPPSLHLSDEGAVLDGLSMDDVGEHGSSITTERESVESGVGMRYGRELSNAAGRYPTKV